jgi:hypothetical protein
MNALPSEKGSVMARFYRVLAMCVLAVGLSVSIPSEGDAMGPSAAMSNHCVCKGAGPTTPGYIYAMTYEPMYGFIWQTEFWEETYFGAGYENPFWCAGYCASVVGTEREEMCSSQNLGSEAFTEAEFCWVYYTSGGTFGDCLNSRDDEIAGPVSCAVPRTRRP